MEEKIGFRGSVRKVFLVLVNLLILFQLVSCGAGKTIIMEPASNRISVKSVSIIEGQSTVLVPIEVAEEFKEELSAVLFNEGDFVRGEDLTVTYRFLQYDPGDQFIRWFWGGIGEAGQGSMTIEAVFSDSSGGSLAKIQSEGEIGSGFFGGDFSFAIEKAAGEIGEYTLTNFK